jgi:hypothetical protein
MHWIMKCNDAMAVWGEWRFIIASIKNDHQSKVSHRLVPHGRRYFSHGSYLIHGSNHLMPKRWQFSTIGKHRHLINVIFP